MSVDEYRRGMMVERERQRKRCPARGRYRGVLPATYTIGLTMFTIVSLYTGPEPAFAVYLVTHVFYTGLTRANIRPLRGQSINWDASRRLWFDAASALPFVMPAYCVHSDRVIYRENESRDLSD